MPKIHVVPRKEDLHQERLADKVVLVLDVLFATSTIVTVLAKGAREVIPALDETDARAQAGLNGACLLAGEKNIRTISGFASPLPLALLRENPAHRSIIYSTTNGTVALRQAAGAAAVYAAALLNGAAAVQRVITAHPEQTVLIVCAGSGGSMNLEDFYGAGYLVDLLQNARRDYDCSDAARAARMLYQHTDAGECLLASRIGRIISDMGHAEEVRFAARKSEFDAVPVLRNGRLQLY
ncbi:MAG: 2-phosphosulfolactate phosphatase [Burkholderiales bacterium]